MRRLVVLLGFVALLAGPAAAQPGGPAAAPEAKQDEGRRAPAKQPARKRAPHQLALEDLLLKAQAPLVRESAAQVLGLRGEPGSVGVLTRALSKDSNKWVRARSAESLGLIGSSSGIPGLTAALADEKDQRVRRMIAQALVRLGQGSGVNELMWQLRAGTNNTKAEVMAFLVGITGEPLGQDVDAWWAYLHEHGRIFLARRPGGTPAVVALQGVGPRGGPARLGPFLFAQRPFTWQQVPAVVIRLEPTLGPISRAVLEKHEQVAGKLADGCLLLIHTRWQEAKTSPPALAPSGKGAVSGVPPTPPAGPTTAWLEPEALRYLLQQAPRLLGVAIDTPSLDPPGAAHPLRDQLLASGRLAIESLGDMDRLLPRSSRLLLFAGAPTATILALLP